MLFFTAAVLLCAVQNQGITLGFFFFIYFFIVRLPHWILDLSLNAQPGVNKFFLLLIYIPHFMMKLCRIIVCIVFICF